MKILLFMSLFVSVITMSVFQTSPHHELCIKIDPQNEGSYPIWLREPDFRKDEDSLKEYILVFPRSLNGKIVKDAAIYIKHEVGSASIPLMIQEEGELILARFSLSREISKMSGCSIHWDKIDINFKPTKKEHLYPIRGTIKFDKYVENQPYQSRLRIIRNSHLNDTEFNAEFSEMEAFLNENNFKEAIKCLEQMLKKEIRSNNNCRDAIVYLLERCRQFVKEDPVGVRSKKSAS